MRQEQLQIQMQDPSNTVDGIEYLLPATSAPGPDSWDVDLTSLSVGFDLRLHPDTSARLPDVERLTVCYTARPPVSGDMVVCGTRAAVAGVLERAGYRIHVSEGAGLRELPAAEVEALDVVRDFTRDVTEGEP